MTALKSLLVSGCALLAWSMPPVFLTSTLTSCEKLEDLLVTTMKPTKTEASQATITEWPPTTEQAPTSNWKQLAWSCLP